jgi:hypothetical protein
MTNPTGLSFQFQAQHLIEQYITDGLLKTARAGLSPGDSLRALGRDEQILGDLHVQGSQRDVTLEMKIESYPTSVFIETMQFWVNRETQTLDYNSSWAYKLQADYLLHLSDDTGYALIVPRKKWLEVCTDLQEAYLFSSLQLNNDEPLRPFVIPNCRRIQGVPTFTGGAAGLAVGLKHAVLAYEMYGYDFDDVYFVDWSELLHRLLAHARNKPDNIISWYAHGASAGVRDACWDALRRWLDRNRQEKLIQNKDTLADIRRTVLGFGAQLVRDHELGRVLSELVARPAQDDYRLPIERHPRFMMEACARCGAVNERLNHSRELLNQAMSFDLVGAHGEALSAQRLIFGEHPTKTGRRPAADELGSRTVKAMLRKRGTPEWSEYRRAYLEQAQHPQMEMA